jgi:hypothetical protein
MGIGGGISLPKLIVVTGFGGVTALFSIGII